MGIFLSEEYYDIWGEEINTDYLEAELEEVEDYTPPTPFY